MSDHEKAASIIIDSVFNRDGIKSHDLGDKKSAIEDLKIAAQLFKTQNNPEQYSKTIELIQKISNP
jgi:hypothetical protein